MKKIPRCLDDGSANNSFSCETIKDWFRAAYLEVLDLVIEAIKDHFDQPRYAIYHNLEELLVKGAAGQEFGDEMKQVCQLLPWNWWFSTECATGKSNHLFPEWKYTCFSGKMHQISPQLLRWCQVLLQWSICSDTINSCNGCHKCHKWKVVFCDAPCKELLVEYNVARAAKSCHGIEYLQGTAWQIRSRCYC